MYIYTYLKCANPTCQYYVHRLRLRKRLLAPLLGGVQICGSIRGKKLPTTNCSQTTWFVGFAFTDAKPEPPNRLNCPDWHRTPRTAWIWRAGRTLRRPGSKSRVPQHDLEMLVWPPLSSTSLSHFHSVSSHLIHPSVRPSIHPSLVFPPTAPSAGRATLRLLGLFSSNQFASHLTASKPCGFTLPHNAMISGLAQAWLVHGQKRIPYIDIYIYIYIDLLSLSLYLCLFIYFIYSFIYIVISVCDYICIGGKKRMLRISHEMKGNATNWTNHESFSAFYWNILEQFINHDGHPLGPQPPPLKKNLWCQEA